MPPILLPFPLVLLLVLVPNLPASTSAMVQSTHLKRKSFPPNMAADGGRLSCSFIIKPSFSGYVPPHWPPSWFDASDFSPLRVRRSRGLLETVSVESMPGSCACVSEVDNLTSTRRRKTRVGVSEVRGLFKASVEQSHFHAGKPPGKVSQ